MTNTLLIYDCHLQSSYQDGVSPAGTSLFVHVVSGKKVTLDLLRMGMLDVERDVSLVTVSQNLQIN